MDEEKLYLQKKGYDTDIYGIICWPESQMYQEENEIDIETQLINDEEGLELFGSSAFIIEKQ